MKNHIDYSSPLNFFLAMGLFSFAGYQIERLLGIGAVFVFVIWALLTLYVFISISKKQLPANHPAVFFALAITFTLTGYYISATLNAESFMLLLAWLMVTKLTLCWVKNNPDADKRLFKLLGMQLIALAFIVPALLQYANLDLLKLCQTAMTSVMTHGHASPTLVGCTLLNALEKIVLIISILVGFSAWRRVCCSTSTCCNDKLAA